MNKLFRILTIICLISLLLPLGFQTINMSSVLAAGPSAAPSTGGGKAGITSVALSPDGVFAQDVNSGTSTSTSCTSTGKDKHLFYNYGINIPGGTITGIIVQLNALVNGTTGSPKICVQLSWDGGTSWTAAKSTTTLTTRNATYLLGSSADNWGHNWNTTQLNNANFRVRVIDVASNTSRTFSLDWVAVQVFYR